MQARIGAVVVTVAIALLTGGCVDAVGSDRLGSRAVTRQSAATTPTTSCQDPTDLVRTASQLHDAVRVSRAVSVMPDMNLRLCQPVQVHAEWYEVRNGSMIGKLRMRSLKMASVTYDGLSQLTIDAPAESVCLPTIVLVYVGEEPLATREMPPLRTRGGVGNPGQLGEVSGRVVRGEYYMRDLFAAC